MVQLLKDQLLGVGSYGAVCKARSGELLCAAKIINPNLLEPSIMYHLGDHRHRESGSETDWDETKWLKEESEFLFKLRHPNLVQYFGLCHDSDTKLPVFLMELASDSLTHFLKAPHTVAYHTQVDICHNIAEALSFLHSSHIIHKNLCSNNVLLDDHCTAKLTDYGMAMLADLNPRKIPLPFLALRDKLDYIPPEAVEEEPIYTEKMDCFSFGVIIIQILTRLSPKPDSRLKSVTMRKQQQGLPRNLSVPVPEIERRQSHIQLIAQNHPLLSWALKCLKDISDERPSAKELSLKIAALKDKSDYRESERTSRVLKEELEQATDTKERQIFDLQKKLERLTKELDEKDHMIALNQSEAEKLRQELQEKRAESKKFEEIVERRLSKKLPVLHVSVTSGAQQERGEKESRGQNGHCCHFERAHSMKVKTTRLSLEDSLQDDGRSWSCRHCKFSNHPLLSRCESCNCPAKQTD